MINPIVQNILLFKRLSEYTPEQIQQVLQGESAQTVAVILVRLETKKAQGALTLFPPDEQSDIAFKMATANSIPPEFLNEVANEIGNKLRIFDDKDGGHTGAGGQDKMAEILKHMDPSKSKGLLDALAQKDSSMSERIKGKMFLFEDIAKAEPDSLKRSLMSIEIETLALALKGASEEIVKAALGGLTDNRRKMLISEVKYMGPRQRSDVDGARSSVVSTLRGFLDQGILRMKGDESHDEWV